MDKVSKFLQRLILKERKVAELTIEKICTREWKDLDIKRLTGQNDMYRVRKGDIRIIFLDTRDEVQILSIGRRSDTTYK